jgi:hypothetical protein
MPQALRFSLVVASVLFLSHALPLQAGDRPQPKELAQARYVVLGFDVGDAFIAESAPDDARVLPDDRQKLAALRAEIERWGRYKVAARTSQGELFIAIRTGRQGTLSGVGPAGGPASGPPSRSGRVELSTSADALFVYGSMSLGTPLWRGQMAGGLSGSPSPLFERFRADVEGLAK